MIINVRGTSGSGKSTVAFTMIKTLPHVEFKNSAGKIMGYEVDAGLSRKVFIVGSYHTKCGGLDGVPTQQEAADRALWAHESGRHVFMEGLLCSAAGPKGALTIALQGTGQAVFGILDTPIEVCLDRVRARRLARGDERPLNETNTRAKYQQTMSTAKTLAGLGYDVRPIDHTRAFEDVMDIFRSAE